MHRKNPLKKLREEKVLQKKLKQQDTYIHPKAMHAK